nr:pitrilysin family protein [uncultured Albidiferax sp.]
MFAIKNVAISAIFISGSSLFGLNFAQAGIPIQHWTQPSGAQVYLVPSPAIPMLDVQIDFDAGSRRDPAAQAGLASLTAGIASEGVRAVGTAPALDENALGEAWADLGASLDSSASSDRFSFSLRTLTYPDLLDKASALAARQIGEPAFSDSLWQRERQRVAAQLKESATRPATVAGRAFAAAVYGTHPYGYELTAETLARIGADEMRAFYTRSILPCRATVSLVGAVDRAQADALVTRLLARLPATGCTPLPAVADVQSLTQASNQHIPFDAAQAQVLIGQVGYARSDPAFFALLVGNHILGGGGFGSRLTTEVREKRGLSYSVYSSFAPALHAGAFTIGLQTRPDQAQQAIQVAQDVLKRFVADGPTAAELQAAKDHLQGGFALRIDSNRKLLDNVANIAWNHLPLDYLDHWAAQIARVTQADIQTAFARILQPEKMATIVVGEKP